MLVAIYLLCVIGLTRAQERLNDLQFRSFGNPTSATQLQRSAQQFRIPTAFPNGFHSPSMSPALIRHNIAGPNPFGRNRNSLMNSNGLLMMFPTQAGRLIPGLAFNRPAPLSSVLQRPAFPFTPPSVHRLNRGRNAISENSGQRLAGLNQDRPSLSGMRRPNGVTPRGQNVVPQTRPSSSQPRNPATSDKATQRIVDFILGKKSQNTNQNPIQPTVDTISNVEMAKPPPRKSVFPNPTGLSTNVVDINKASPEIRFKSRTDEEIRQEVEERMRQLNAFLARNPAAIASPIHNVVNNHHLPHNIRHYFNNVNRRTERVDQNTLNTRVMEAFKNRDKSGKKPIVVDGGVAEQVMPTIVVDGGVSWRNQGIHLDQNQRPRQFNLETDKELAKLFPIPPS